MYAIRSYYGLVEGHRDVTGAHREGADHHGSALADPSVGDADDFMAVGLSLDEGDEVDVAMGRYGAACARAYQ